MRILAVVVVLVGLVVGTAHANDKLVKQYAGHILISQDPIPTESTGLPAFVKANLMKDRHYDLIKGPPWEVNLIGFLTKDPGKTPVMLVFTDAKDSKLPPIASIEVASKKRIVVTKATATIAAGFEVGKTYVVRLMLGKVVLARCELTLRET
jgi:hypothetical protein